eukprot:6153237-Alexandrium_andersonii.AAC.1
MHARVRPSVFSASVLASLLRPLSPRVWPQVAASQVPLTRSSNCPGAREWLQAAAASAPLWRAA